MSPMSSEQKKSFALTMADEGRKVRIIALRAGRNLDRRLTDLGLNIGSELHVVQRRGGGLVVARGEARVAIGGGMAMKILVVPA
ncbi:MAG: FeoA domain-containing protein [Candidatus Thiosymbion ectosymbiont of Robbea hypermnestra]|nr:FeoA domain-containing protein [Candidatus Thiosymbion ectosymbiont of Robbea hypermnestra]